MNTTNIFKGVVTDIKKIGPNLQSIEISTLSNKLNKETRQFEVKEVKYYLKNFTNGRNFLAIEVGLEGYFYTALEYRTFTSKKAINIETKDFFEYGTFDFIVRDFFNTKEALLKHMFANFGTVVNEEKKEEETAAQILARLVAEKEVEEKKEGITLDEIFSE